MRGSHLICKVANECLIVRERVEEKNEDGILFSPAILWFANDRERKPSWANKSVR